MTDVGSIQPGTVPHPAHFRSVFRKSKDQGISLPRDFRYWSLLVCHKEISGGLSRPQIQDHSEGHVDFALRQVDGPRPCCLFWHRSMAGGKEKQGEEAERNTFPSSAMTGVCQQPTAQS